MNDKNSGKIIAVVNQKGGVGKTTTCINTSFGLANLGKRVLLCDFDSQGNSTSGSGLSKNTAPGSYDVLTRDIDPQLAIHKTKYFDVMPSGKELSGAEIELINLENREYRLRNVLSQIRQYYDYIIIDCPPSLGLLTLNALCAANSFIVPVQCEYYALEGLSDLMHTVKLVRAGKLNAGLEIEGILLTMFDSRTNLSIQVADNVKKHFPNKVYSTVIPRNVRLSEAPSHGAPIQIYDPTSKGADSYNQLAEEIIRKNN